MPPADRKSSRDNAIHSRLNETVGSLRPLKPVQAGQRGGSSDGFRWILSELPAEQAVAKVGLGFRLAPPDRAARVSGGSGVTVDAPNDRREVMVRNLWLLGIRWVHRETVKRKASRARRSSSEPTHVPITTTNLPPEPVPRGHHGAKHRNRIRSSKCCESLREPRLPRSWRRRDGRSIRSVGSSRLSLRGG